MKKLFVLFSLICLVSGFQSVCAMPALDAGSVGSSNMRDLRLHEAVSRAREKSAIVKKEQDIEREKALNEVNQAALTDIKYVTFVNNLSISSKELFTVIQRYINQPMNPVNVSAIRKEIMRYYQKKGFYSVLATVSSENTQTGELVLDIREGGRNSIIVVPSF